MTLTITWVCTNLSEKTEDYVKKQKIHLKSHLSDTLKHREKYSKQILCKKKSSFNETLAQLVLLHYFQDTATHPPPIILAFQTLFLFYVSGDVLHSDYIWQPLQKLLQQVKMNSTATAVWRHWTSNYSVLLVTPNRSDVPRANNCWSLKGEKLLGRKRRASARTSLWSTGFSNSSAGH